TCRRQEHVCHLITSTTNHPSGSHCRGASGGLPYVRLMVPRLETTDNSDFAEQRRVAFALWARTPSHGESACPCSPCHPGLVHRIECLHIHATLSLFRHLRPRP